MLCAAVTKDLKEIRQRRKHLLWLTALETHHHGGECMLVYVATNHEARRTEPVCNFLSPTPRDLLPPVSSQPLEAPHPSEQCHLLVGKLQNMSLWGTFRI